MPQIRSEELRRVMPDVLRYTIYAIFGSVGLTGLWWLILRQFFATEDAFTMLRHPWEPALRLAHAILAVATAYVLGWILARHASEAWRSGKRRLSGSLLTGLLGVVSASGFALFFLSDDAWQLLSARIHELTGLGVTLAAVEHWRLARSSKV